MKYCNFLIYLTFSPLFFLSQTQLVIQKKISYRNIGWTKNTKKNLKCPVKGFVDQTSLQPIYQTSINSGNYTISSFEFNERKLSEEELIPYKGITFDSIYFSQLKKQEQNSKLRNQLLLISCIRYINNQLYLITDFKIKLTQIVKPKSNKKRFRFVNQSVLSDGSSWYKLSNFTPGIYKLDYNFLLSNSIIDGDISSSSIHLFSNNKGLLSLVNDDSRPDDLEQQTIFISDGGDGLFSQGDYVLFYLNGSDRINWDGQNFNHTKHIYSDSAYCFLNINPNRNTKQLVTLNENFQNFNQTVTKFRDFEYINEDKINFLKSGSQWFGDVYDLTNVYNYTFPFNNFIDSSHFKIKLMSKSNYSTAYFYPSIFNINRSVPISSSGSSYYSM